MPCSPWSRGTPTVPLIFNLSTGKEWNPVPIEQDAGRNPEPVRMLWEKEKSFALAGIQNLDHPAHSLVIIPAPLT